MWEYFVAKFSILIAFSFGSLLVVLYPIIKKDNKYFALFSLIVGIIILLLTLYFVFGSPVIREQIFKYGFQ